VPKTVTIWGAIPGGPHAPDGIGSQHVGMPRLERGALPVGHKLAEMDRFLVPSCPQDRVGDVERRQTLVHDPRKRRDIGARQVALELHRLVNRGRFRLRDEQHHGE
jgi:hypothetical protein